MIVGLTGQIGAGKSTVAQILSRLGAVVVDADMIGRQVLDKDISVQQKLIRSFGPQIMEDGRLDRRGIAAAAFANETNRRKLNAIVHPKLLKELHRQTRRGVKAGKIVVIDAALLLEWKLDRSVDYVIVLRAPKSARLARMTARGFAAPDIRRRMRLQKSWVAYRRAADFVITNAGTKADLRRSVAAIWKRLSN